MEQNTNSLSSRGRPRPGALCAYRLPLSLRTFLLCALGWGCTEGDPSPSVDLLITDATVVSAERTTPLRDAWVAIDDGRIVGVGVEPDPPYRGVSHIDGGGMFLAPGLIDSHVHLAEIPGLQFEPDEALRGRLAALYEAQLPKTYLFFGFTTVIDLNVVDPEALNRFRDAPLGPDVFHCGGALALANGYPMAFLPAPVRFDAYPNFLWDERRPDAIPDRFQGVDHSPAAAVARVADSGAVCVKTFQEDGFGELRIWPTPTAELIEQVVSESRARGLTVAMHANSYEAHRFAADAGVDVIVHGLWNWDGLQAPEGVPGPIVQVLADEADAGIGIMPTTRVLGGLRDLFSPTFLDDPRLPDALPGALLEWYRSESGRTYTEIMRAEYGGGDDETLFRALDGAVARAQRVVSHLTETNNTILFGSDTPSGPTYANPPGLNGVMEMRLLSEAGVAPARLLEAATLANARAFGIEREVGSIEVGKVANLLLLRSNPLESVDAWTDIDAVVVRGVLVERSTLSARNQP